MIHALVSGVVVGEAKSGTSQKGTSWTRVGLRVGEGEGATFVGVLAFGAEAEALLELAKSDALAAAGRFEIGSYVRDGRDVPSYTVVGARVLTARPKKKKAASPRERALEDFPDDAGNLDEVPF